MIIVSNKPGATTAYYYKTPSYWSNRSSSAPSSPVNKSHISTSCNTTIYRNYWSKEETLCRASMSKPNPVLLIKVRIGSSLCKYSSSSKPLTIISLSKTSVLKCCKTFQYTKYKFIWIEKTFRKSILDYCICKPDQELKISNIKSVRTNQTKSISKTPTNSNLSF